MDILVGFLVVVGIPVLLALAIIWRAERKEVALRKATRKPITTPHNTATFASRARPSHDTTQDQGPDMITTLLVIDALTDEVRRHEPEPAPYEAPPTFQRHYEVDNTPSTTYDDSHSKSTSWGDGSSSSYDSGSSSSSDSSSTSWD